MQLEPAKVEIYALVHSLAFSALPKLTLLVTIACFTLGSSGQGCNGTWSNPNGGSWTNPANWAGGTIADGSGNTANFGTLN